MTIPSAESRPQRGVAPVKWTNKDGTETTRYRARIVTKFIQADRCFDTPEEALEFRRRATAASKARAKGDKSEAALRWDWEPKDIGANALDRALADFLAQRGIGLAEMEGAVSRATAALAQQARGKRDLSKEHLLAAARLSSSLSDLSRRLGYSHSGGNHKLLRGAAKRHGIDLDALFRAEPKERSVSVRSQEDMALVFRENSPTDRGTVKRLLLERNLKEYRCEHCGNRGEWQGLPLALQLEHANGANDDNRLENLKFLCPNCHSQTPTYGGKNRKYRVGAFVPAVCGDLSGPGARILAPMPPIFFPKTTDGIAKAPRFR